MNRKSIINLFYSGQGSLKGRSTLTISLTIKYTFLRFPLLTQWCNTNQICEACGVISLLYVLIPLEHRFNFLDALACLDIYLSLSQWESKSYFFQLAHLQMFLGWLNFVPFYCISGMINVLHKFFGEQYFLLGMSLAIFPFWIPCQWLIVIAGLYKKLQTNVTLSSAGLIFCVLLRSMVFPNADKCYIIISGFE